MEKTAFVDQDICIGCGICVGNLPDVFHFASNGKAECFDPNGASEEEIQLQAMDVCPVACIHWK
jgi:ferredoxin